MMNPVYVLFLLNLKLFHASAKALLNCIYSCQHPGLDLFMLLVDSLDFFFVP